MKRLISALLLALFVAIGLLPTIKRLNSPDIGGSATVTPVTAQAVPEPGALGLLVMVGALARRLGADVVRHIRPVAHAVHLDGFQQ